MAADADAEIKAKLLLPLPKRVNGMVVFMTVMLSASLAFCLYFDYWLGAVLYALLIVGYVRLIVARWQVVGRLQASHKRLMLLEAILASQKHPYSEDGNSVLLTFLFPSESLIAGVRLEGKNDGK